MNDSYDETQDNLSTDRYEIGDTIGEGSFGCVKMGTNMNTGEPVAIKLVANGTMKEIEYEMGVMNFLEEEYIEQQKLNRYYEDAVFGFPRAYAICVHQGMNGIIMERMGKDLDYYFKLCGGIFSIKTVCMIAVQIIDRLEWFHYCGFVHRDIKPNNFVMGYEKSKNKNHLHLIDFGLAKKFITNKGRHIACKTGKSPIGTIRYASINNHMGVTLSRRDDLESSLYMCIYFLKGRLPWQGERGKTKKDHYENILKSKFKNLEGDLFKGIPDIFEKCIDRVRFVAFDQPPPYDTLRKLFCNYMAKNNIALDLQYDWVVLEKNQRANQNNLQ
jgi:serine/threonine protein kinase